MENPKHERLKSALENFEKAWNELSQAWGYDNPIEVESYPFESSFDDYDVETWVADFKARLDDEILLSNFKYITERPANYDELNNLDLRSAFEDEENEPIIHTQLKACGYVGNRPADFDGAEHEDDTWAIDQYDEDGLEVYQSFLYTSELEYEQDCEILGL